MCNNTLDQCVIPHYDRLMTRSTDELLSEIESFIAANGMSATAFGELSMGDRHLLRRLRSGGSVTLDTADAIHLFMRAYQPIRSRRSRSGNASVAA